MGFTKNIFTDFLNLIAPQTCMACEDLLPQNEKFFCEACDILIERKKHGPSAFVYGGPMGDAICKLKYNRRIDLAPRFAELLISNIESYRGGIDAIVPVPLHWMKLIKRGYNQSSLIAHHISKKLEIPIRHNILKKTKNTPSQTKLKKSKRIQNLEQAFAAKPDKRFSRILLFDDIRTTGSTLKACEMALLHAGYYEVHHLTLASQD